LPGSAEGNWAWRFSWEQLDEQKTERLYKITALHGRCESSRLILI